METIAELGLPLAVHAESDRITADLAARARAAGRTRTADYLASRPPVAESEAIARAIELATSTGCTLHIVHVSTARGVDLVAVARERGLDVTCEVTAHHLVLTDEDAVALGAVAKCAPPLRPRAETEALWERLADGRIGCVVSDHSPAPPELKSGEDAFAIWGGISGVQSTLEVLLTEGRLAPARLAEATATAAAARFALPGGKGTVVAGADADLVLVRCGEPRELTAGELRYRHPHSPYVGRTLSARVARTMLRGRTIYADGAIAGTAQGRLLRPARKPSR
jgi:allantoinase